MRLNKILLILPLAILLMLGACNNIPDHSKYIPEDAAAVISINTKEMSKEIAWSYLSGSKLFKEMMRGSGTDSNSFSPEKSGIDIMNTIYIFGRKDARYNTQYNNSGMQIVVLMPLDDAKKWEDMITKKMQGETVTEVNGRKQIKLGSDFIAIWKDKLVMIVNEPRDNSADFKDVVDDLFAGKNSIAKDKKFSALIKKNHDIAAWMNYETLMQEAMSSGVGGMGIIGSLSSAQELFKDAIVTFGLDFEKGKVKGMANYYVSKKMQDLMGNKNESADADMVDRLPKDNMNVVGSFKLLPKQMIDMVDLLGVKGLLNMELGKHGFTTEEIINAFSGDMAFTLNNFTTVEKPNPYAYYYDNMDTANMPKYYDNEMDFLYVMKIQNRQTIDKIVALGTKDSIIRSIGTDSYVLKGGSDSIFLIMNKEYVTISNRGAHGPAFLSGSYKGGSNEGIKYISGSNMGIYWSIESMLSQLKTNSVRDKASIENAQKLFKDLKVKSLGFNDGAYQSEMILDMKDDTENSLLQLINFAGTLN